MPDEITGDELKLLRLCIECRRDEYKEMSENWRHLDTKAQGNIAISGILLAAVVAFLSKGQSLMGTIDRCLIILTVAIVGWTILWAVLSLRIRTVAGAPYFGSMQNIVEDFLKAASLEERSRRLGDLHREELSLWAQCNDEISRCVNAKATMLARAQVGILAATVIASIFTIVQLFK